MFSNGFTKTIQIMTTTDPDIIPEIAPVRLNPFNREIVIPVDQMQHQIQPMHYQQDLR